MKRHIPYIIIAAALPFLSLWSCTRVEMQEEDSRTGYLYVSLDRDDSEEIVFKSVEEAETPFILKIYNELDQLVETVEDHRTLANTPLVLKVGTYTVVASSAEESAAAQFDAPFYSGSAEFEVQPDQVTNIDVTCSLANVKVTTSFSDEIQQNFQVWQLTVSNGSGSLVFSNTEDSVGKTGYFSPTGRLTWTLYLKNNDGRESTVSETYDDVKPKQHYNLSFSLEEKEEGGAGGFFVVVDNSFTEKEYDLVLDFGDEDKPEISTDFEYTESGQVDVYPGDNVSRVLTLAAADGFKNVILSYGTSSETAATLAAALPQTDLVDASPDDISRLAEAGIVTSSISSGATEATIDITAYISGQPMGSTSVSILAVDQNGAFQELNLEFMIQSAVEAEAVSADPWAMFATLNGKWFTSAMPEGLAFQYRKSSESSWTDVPASSVTPDAAARTYTATVTGLEPQTEYVFRAVSAKDTETKEISFTTESAEVLHNMNFDNWYQSGKYWMPNLDSSYSVWDSANPGSGKFGITPTNPEESDVAVSGPGKKAAKLKSEKAMIVLAAGNIYTGKFGNTSGLGAYLDWGVPFSSRPLALKGYYKYQPVTIDMAKDPYTSMKGQMDICQIQILLTDWDQPFTVNTNSGTFVDFDNDPHIIAYGKMEDNTSSASYKEFEIKLKYRDTERTPKYIVITACASKYGDYFTGGVGSTLLVDEFEFVYNPDDLSE